MGRHFVNRSGEHVIVVDPWDEDAVETFLLNCEEHAGIRVICVSGEYRLVFPPSRAQEATHAKLTFC